jgi:hypothetical protein
VSDQETSRSRGAVIGTARGHDGAPRGRPPVRAAWWAAWLACALAILALSPAPPLRAQAAPPIAAPPPTPQHPSPMTESTRRHERLTERALPGTMRRLVGPAGAPVELWIPARPRASMDLVVHFHGAAWLAQQAVAAHGTRAVVAVLNLGSGSGVYDRRFSDPAAFDSLLVLIARDLAEATGRPTTIGRVTLSGFSAGHGAVRAILREARHVARVDAVLLLDGLHTSYRPEGTVLAAGGVLDTTNLVALTAFARAAMRGDKRLLITHSEIFPGTFASTTETADWMLASLGLQRTPVVRFDARGMQQLSAVRAGGFTLLGYAGNSAPDHIDQFHAMPEQLARLLK